MTPRDLPGTRPFVSLPHKEPGPRLTCPSFLPPRGGQRRSRVRRGRGPSRSAAPSQQRSASLGAPTLFRGSHLSGSTLFTAWFPCRVPSPPVRRPWPLKLIPGAVPPLPAATRMASGHTSTADSSPTRPRLEQSTWKPHDVA